MAASYASVGDYGHSYNITVQYYTEEYTTYTVHGADDLPGSEGWQKSFKKSDIDAAGLIEEGELLLLPELLDDSGEKLSALKKWKDNGGSLQGASMFNGRTVVVRSFDGDDKLYAYLFDLVGKSPGELYYSTELFKTNDTTSLRIPKQYSLQRVLNGVGASILTFTGGFKQLTPVFYDFKNE